METFIEKQELAFNDQLDGFCDEIDDYATPLNLDTGKIKNLQGTNDLVQFVYRATENAQKYAHDMVAYKSLLRFGIGKEVLGDVPVPPVYSVLPPPVTSANARGQFADLIQDCVNSGNLTTNIGQALGIIKPATVFDPQAGTPVLKVTLAQGGHPLLHANMSGYEAFQIWRDSNDGKGYLQVGTSLHPDYLDLSALPLGGVATAWKYKLIYVYKNQQAGAWSNEVVISVYGNV